MSVADRKRQPEFDIQACTAFHSSRILHTMLLLHAVYRVLQPTANLDDDPHGPTNFAFDSTVSKYMQQNTWSDAEKSDAENENRHNAIARNRQAWNDMARAQKPLARPVQEDDFRDPLRAIDAPGWLGASIDGKNVLCLAAGGGRQSALFAAAGADVTVVDLSPAMLEQDRIVAEQRGLNINIVETSMDELGIFRSGQFEIVVQPVSSCYLPRIAKLYQQVARVTRPGGLYISQHKQPTSLQAGVAPTSHGYLISETYYREGPLPPAPPSRIREQGAVEFLHRWEQLVGGLCRSGFVVEDLIEPMMADSAAKPGEFGHRCCHIAPYVRIKARRTASPVHESSLPHQSTCGGPAQEGSQQDDSGRKSRLWTPE